MLEDLGDFAKVWCKKCDVYGHHIDSCWVLEETFDLPNVVSGFDMKGYKEMYERYLNGYINLSDCEEQKLSMEKRLKQVLKIKNDAKVLSKPGKNNRSTKISNDKRKEKIRPGVLNRDEKFLLKERYEPIGFMWETKKELTEKKNNVIEQTEKLIKS